jgi:hypothetical protein
MRGGLNSMIKVVTTENGEIVEFNLLDEYVGTTWYQSDLENLTKDECQKKGIEYSNQYAKYFPNDLPNFKEYNQFYYGEDDSLVFYGEIYEWNTKEYADSGKAEILLDRGDNPGIIVSNCGYILVKFYSSEKEFDARESQMLIKSMINGKKTVVKVLKDYYPDNRKSYRVLMDNIDNKGVNVLIIADNIDENYIIRLIEHFANVENSEL